MEATLLIELLTEELPPKSLGRLSEAFCDALVADLKQDGFLTERSTVHRFATPRRLAVSMTRVRAKAPDTSVEERGPSVKVGLGPEGTPTPALIGFARKHGVEVGELVQVDTPKGPVFACRKIASGSQLETNLDLRVEEALKRFSFARLMYWGNGQAQFVRPVHGLVMLHGERVVPGTVLGIAAGNATRGHRFMSKGEVALASADEYEAKLRDEGMVVARFDARKTEIENQLRARAGELGAVLGSADEVAPLLDEVTALVEHPSVYVGAFDATFLDMPPECLILTMRQNQKYFPLFDAAGKLLPQFLIVSNMRVADPRHIIGGNERVVRPRLEDARFFYDQDRKTRLEDRVPQLAKVIYHGKLGTQLERVERIQLLAGRIARELGANAALAERAAWLAKADLATGMVGEFPELQGTMGRYYALHDGEPREVADAIEAHYRPRFSGDRLPQGLVACAVALADKLDALVGMFSVGGAPTGDKDPFALRRAALGVLRILMEATLPLSLTELLAAAADHYRDLGIPPQEIAPVRAFTMERLRYHLREAGHAPDEIESVLSSAPVRIDLVPARLEAIRIFRALPEAESLARANKRIRNILRKSDATEGELDESLLREPAERALFDAVRGIEPEVAALMARGEYRESLGAVAKMQVPVDAFFDKVLVNADDPGLRANRHALLKRLDALLNQVADISKLAQ